MKFHRYSSSFRCGLIPVEKSLHVSTSISFMIISERHTIERIDQLITLVFPFMLAIVCMFLFEGYKINVARIKTYQWIVARKNAVISCGPGQLLTAANNHVHDADPQNKRNGHNCTHLQGANLLCEAMGYRRRTITFMPVGEK